VDDAGAVTSEFRSSAALCWLIEEALSIGNGVTAMFISCAKDHGG
jgi:hypothetical protein